MVKQGFFSAEIVYADTKVKFQEHTAPDGQVYVEVEPDAEYFIRVRSEYPAKALFYFTIDGEDLGYRKSLSKDTTSEAGLWSLEGSKETMRALVFVKTPVRLGGNAEDAPPYWTGEVKVTIYEAIYKGTYQKMSRKNKWEGGDVGYQIGAGDPSKKKGLKSSKGEHFESKKVPTVGHKFSKGQLLDTITLKYCSTIGLIHAGILPKPPAWDLHRMRYPNPNGPPTQSDDKNIDLTGDDG